MGGWDWKGEMNFSSGCAALYRWLGGGWEASPSASCSRLVCSACACTQAQSQPSLTLRLLYTIQAGWSDRVCGETQHS